MSLLETGSHEVTFRRGAASADALGQESRSFADLLTGVTGHLQSARGNERIRLGREEFTVGFKFFTGDERVMQAAYPDVLVDGGKSYQVLQARDMADCGRAFVVYLSRIGP